LKPEFLSTHPAPPPVDSYGPRRIAWDRLASSEEVDRDVSEHLKALGYMD